MPSDNVTPFRRPKPVRPQQQGGLGIKTHRGKVVIAHILTIAAFVANFALRTAPWSFIGMIVGIAAVVIVFSNRGAAMPWANTHHEHALRTLIIGYSLWVLAGLLVLINGSLVTITIFLQLGVAIWAVARAGVALVLGVMRKPVPNPRGWFI
jgi:uncharacterized membrane protein